MENPRNVGIEELAEDGSSMTIKAGKETLTLTLAEADLLYRMMISACAIGVERQRDAGLLPMVAETLTPHRVSECRVLAKAGEVLLELRLRKANQPEEIASVLFDPDLADQTGVALVTRATECRQRRRPS